MLSLEKVVENVIHKHDLMFLDYKNIDIVNFLISVRYKENIKPSCVPSYNYFVINENNDFSGIIYYCL